MEIRRIGSQPSAKGPADWFTGTVRIDPLFQAHAPARAAGASVTFEPGARTAWHTHPLGQTLIITAGCGWVQREGGPVEEVHPGDVVWFPPGEKHWHGASPTTAMTHIAIQEQLDGKVVDWLEHVSDEQYRKLILRNGHLLRSKVVESGIRAVALTHPENRPDDPDDLIREWGEADRAAGANGTQVANLLHDPGRFRGGQRLISSGAAAEDGFRILVSVLAWGWQRFGFLGDIGSMSELQSPRDRRGVGQEPGLDARVGHPDRGRIIRQFKVAPSSQLFELIGVFPLGVNDEHHPSRSIVKGLALREPDLLPQFLPLEECQRPAPDSHRLGPIAQPVDDDRHDAGGREFRLVSSPAEVGPPFADDLDDVAMFHTSSHRVARETGCPT